MTGGFCRLELLDVERHAADLWAANSLDREGRIWTYLPWGPFGGFDQYLAYLQVVAPKKDPLIHAIIDTDTGKAVGVASYLRINADAGTIEVGGLAYSPLLQRRPAATEAMYLMMRRIFDELGYRRYEWKCNALNAPSRAAAMRLGFQSKESFVRAMWLGAATATRRGLRSSTRNGRRYVPRSSAGSIQAISMRPAGSASAYRR
jgi:RimJ/RimL family protein N-acetyltransferase